MLLPARQHGMMTDEYRKQDRIDSKQTRSNITSCNPYITQEQVVTTKLLQNSN